MRGAVESPLRDLVERCRDIHFVRVLETGDEALYRQPGHWKLSKEAEQKALEVPRHRNNKELP